MTSEEQLREMAAHWISPADPELTKFATGHSAPVDWDSFLSEVENCYQFISDPDDTEAMDALDALFQFAQSKVNER